ESPGAERRRFLGQAVEIVPRVQTACVHADTIARPAAQQVVDGLSQGLAHQVPQRDVHGADGLDRDALAAVVDRAPEHLPPEQFNIEWARSQDDRLQGMLDDVRGSSVAHAGAREYW